MTRSVDIPAAQNGVVGCYTERPTGARFFLLLASPAGPVGVQFDQEARQEVSQGQSLESATPITTLTLTNSTSKEQSVTFFVGDRPYSPAQVSVQEFSADRAAETFQYSENLMDGGLIDGDGFLQVPDRNGTPIEVPATLTISNQTFQRIRVSLSNHSNRDVGVFRNSDGSDMFECLRANSDKSFDTRQTFYLRAFADPATVTVNQILLTEPIA